MCAGISSLLLKHGSDSLSQVAMGATQKLLGGTGLWTKHRAQPPRKQLGMQTPVSGTWMNMMDCWLGLRKYRYKPWQGGWVGVKGLL